MKTTSKSDTHLKQVLIRKRKSLGSMNHDDSDSNCENDEKSDDSSGLNFGEDTDDECPKKIKKK